MFINSWFQQNNERLKFFNTVSERCSTTTDCWKKISFHNLRKILPSKWLLGKADFRWGKLENVYREKWEKEIAPCGSLATRILLLLWMKYSNGAFWLHLEFAIWLVFLLNIYSAFSFYFTWTRWRKYISHYITLHYIKIHIFLKVRRFVEWPWNLQHHLIFKNKYWYVITYVSRLRYVGRHP